MLRRIALQLSNENPNKNPREATRGVFSFGVQLRHNLAMDSKGIVALLQARLPRLMAVYAFGSRVRDGGQQAQSDSDLDLAVLVEGYADPVELFELSGLLSDRVSSPVDLLDLRAASTVMQHQILMHGERLWARDVQAGLFEAAMLTEKLHLDEARGELLKDIMQRGTVYGR
jgi:predicted nucleotidyltransferase